MNERQLKVLLLGAKGYERTTDSVRLDCLLWENLNKLKNIRDYDLIILNLLAIPSREAQEQVDWDVFVRHLDFSSAIGILLNGGKIIVVGDPRFTIPTKTDEELSNTVEDTEQSSLMLSIPNFSTEQPFLNWTGANFVWDSSPGNTIEFNEYRHERYKEYISKLKKWEYSKCSCKLTENFLGNKYGLGKLIDYGFEFNIREDDFCFNRYHNALIFELFYQIQTKRDKIAHKSYGSVLFLPQVSLSEDETLQMMLTTICGIETNLPEPEWLPQFIAPGQKAIDDEIQQISTEIKNLSDNLQQAELRKDECRKCLKLLYEREFALEPVVWDMLRSFGADVEEPEEKNKEDGWIKVVIEGKTFEGVLEIKSTKNEQFNEGGRKQLLDWIDRGRTLRSKNYKGLFIGNSAVGKPINDRPLAFSDSWIQAAELSGICALKTEDLYVIHLLKEKGEIDLNQFWVEIFATDGVFDIKKYMEQLQSKE